MRVSLNSNDYSYDVVIRRGCFHEAKDELNLDRKVLVVTDDGVPAEYAKELASYCKEPYIVTITQGEDHKSIESFDKLLGVMLENDFSRADCVVAVGGGVIGDLSGFVAASYMRGVDFYNIPTTILSQVDSSIGGKTAINFGGVKNIVGAFYQPKRVLIDTDLTKTLPKRQLSNGLAEAVKMAANFDEELFNIFETEDPFDYLDVIVERSVDIKRRVVEEDEKESGLRKVLNFGHTIGHGIELTDKDQKLYHGECVAIGMVAMASEEVRERLIPVLRKLELPVSCKADPESIYAAMKHDKKAVGSKVTGVLCDRIGTFELKKMDLEELKERIYQIVED